MFPRIDSAQARRLLHRGMTSEPDMDDAAARSAQTGELERRLLEAAEALLEHHGSPFALVPLPGQLPVRCVAIGELAWIREMVKSQARSG